MAAMDYAKTNLARLAAKGYAVDSLNDVEKARIMYLCHHLGLVDAVHFIQETIPEENVYGENKKGKKVLKQNGAKKLLIAQVGEKKAEKKYVKPNGESWVQGHRMWLDGFVQGSIIPSRYTCAPKDQEFAKNEKVRLIDIVDGIRK